MAMPAYHSIAAAIPAPSDFVNASGGKQEYMPAQEIADLAGDLIERFSELSELATFEFTYLWKREGGKKKGDVVLGNLSTTSGFVRYFTEADFILWMAADHLYKYQLSDQQIEAAVFHQLMHATSENGVPATRQHDIEGFAAELRHFGTWTQELKMAKKAFDQATLPLFGPVPLGTTG
jgi:hypothetical protein